MALSVPDICDDHSGRLQVLDPVFRSYGGRRKFCGKVVTVRCFEDNSLVKSTLSGEGQGQVLVVDGSGSMRCALLGDLLGAMARDNGWSGVLVNGCVRDVEILETIDLGVLALNRHPARSNKRGEGDLNIPVRFHGVNFRHGQFLYADENGVVVAEADLGVDFS
ncbi:MAG: ribonuclease E activity regulator RraA [Thiohalobacterales bacterium]|nr:ribonuclease E activity regulator RraA [Thiohalobacterales bacterium]